jgi:hypothetical protein
VVFYIGYTLLINEYDSSMHNVEYDDWQDETGKTCPSATLSTTNTTCTDCTWIEVGYS